MGFFLPDEPVVTAAPTVTRKRGPSPRAERVLDPNARGCDSCTLKAEWPRLASPRMRPTGEGDILVLGEAPGENEDLKGEQFVGDSGKLIRAAIPGKDRDRLVWQNTVRCRPPGNRDPSPGEAHACSLLLEEDLAQHGIKAILGVGGVPLKRFIPETAIQRIHGIRFPVRIGAGTYWYYPVLHPSFVLRLGGERGIAHPVFQADIRNFFREVNRWPAPQIATVSPADVLLPRTLEEAQAIVARMERPIASDIETSTLRPYEAKASIITAAVSDGKLTCAWPVHHPEGPTEWGERFLLELMAGTRYIAHSSMFEYSWFDWRAKALGLDLDFTSFDDTQAQTRLYFERETLLDLNICSQIILGVGVKGLTGVSATRIMSYSLAEVLPYNGLDAWASALIFRKLDRLVKRVPYQRLLDTEVSCSDMESLGLTVDLDKATALDDEWTIRQEDAGAKAKTYYEVRQFEIERQQEFNIASAVDVGNALVQFGRVELPRLKTQFATDDQTLHTFAPDNPLAKVVLEYRNAAKMRSTYIYPCMRAVEYPDGLLHAGYKVPFTATLRLSSEDPNVQNFPKRAKEGRKLREMIIAAYERRTGVKLIFASFDFKQLEARIIGCASQDSALCQSIIDEKDIHGDWRDNILEVHPEYLDRLREKSGEQELKAVLKSGRDTIKTDFVFASFYGASANSIAERTGLPLFVVQEVWSYFWETYRGVKKWIKAQRNQYRDTGSVHTLTGLTRHAILKGNEPLNNPIQGTAAAVVVEAQNVLASLARKERDPFLHPRINIHDDLTFIFPDDERLMPYIERVGPLMVEPRFDWQVAPLSVSCAVGYDWANLEDVATFTGDYVR